MTQNLPFIYVDADPDIKYPEQGVLITENSLSLALPHPTCLLPDPEHAHTAKGLIDNIAYLCKMGAGRQDTYLGNTPFERSYMAGTRVFNKRYFQNYTHLIYDLKFDFSAGDNIEDILTDFSVREENKIDKIFLDFQEYDKPKNLKKRSNTSEIQSIMNANFFVGVTENFPEFKIPYNTKDFGVNNRFKHSMPHLLTWNTSLLCRKAMTIHAIDNNIKTVSARDKLSSNYHDLITTIEASMQTNEYRYSPMMNQFANPLALANDLQYAMTLRNTNGRPNLGGREMERFAARLGEFAQNYDKNHALNEKKVFPVVKSSLTNAVNSYNTGGIQPGGHLRAS